MLPSSTVENYLKAIFLGTAGSREGEARSLLPMGQLASALSVAPGTATAMVKTLSESGLVRYEPYAGVALTPAGERLAALVVRRHRLLELFLVQVLGFGWDEVHDEAEHLEHAVSDRLIDRIDEMLGRPEVDPHGDPIPDAEGSLRREQMQTLLTCPLNTAVTVRRVVDQDKVVSPIRRTPRPQTRPDDHRGGTRHGGRQRPPARQRAPNRSPSARAPRPKFWSRRPTREPASRARRSGPGTRLRPALSVAASMRRIAPGIAAGSSTSASRPVSRCVSNCSYPNPYARQAHVGAGIAAVSKSILRIADHDGAGRAWRHVRRSASAATRDPACADKRPSPPTVVAMNGARSSASSSRTRRCQRLVGQHRDDRLSRHVLERLTHAGYGRVVSSIRPS